jgi:uncharacterized protein (TIGR00266 family)
MSSHEVDYEIFGDDMQVVEVELDPTEVVIAEAGAMNYMEDGIEFETRMGDGSQPSKGIFSSLLSVGKRVLTGESIFMTHFTNTGQGKKRVAFAGTHPGKIIAVDMNTHGGELICQKDAFLCAAFGTSIDIAFRRKLGVGFFGGEGFILQRLKGDGMAFIHIGGTVIKRELRPDEVLRVDTGCLAAMTADVDYNIERSGNLKTMLFGGEGVFLATLRGPGTVYVQSMPFSRLVNRILRTVGSRTSKSSASNNDSSFDDARDDD